MTSPDGTRTLAYRLAYDGARYHGMQLQPDQPTVQGAVEDALARILKAPTRIRFAGRTDTGVHATAQVVAFEVATRIPAEALRDLVNRKLAPGAALGTAWEADPGFHPRHRATSRAYTYVMEASGVPPDPFRAGRGTFVEPDLDWAGALETGRVLVGTHDFRAFCVQPDREEKPVRSIDVLELHRRGPYLLLEVRGRSFLRGQVRHLVGALLAVARGKKPHSYLEDLLALGARGEKDDHLVPAPPDGLYLTDVVYPEGLPGPTPLPASSVDDRRIPWLPEESA
jgi:tRNA pseudouridine38-40 synthase